MQAPDFTAPVIRGTTELMFTVADPVAQVKAPEALNLVFAEFGVDAVVVPAKVAHTNFEAFVGATLTAENVRGMLVSIPHKTRLAAMLDHRDAASALAGAANAVRRKRDGSIDGALFDGSGFVGALRHHDIATAGRRVLLLGAGGAGLAIAGALAMTSDAPSELAVFDATSSRAQALVDQIQAFATSASTMLSCAASADPDAFDLVINATPLGLRPTDPLPVDTQRLGRAATVVDILMKDQPTPLERACLELGVAVVTGHEMMVQQIPDYLDFFGFDNIAEALRRADHPTMRAVRHAMLGSRAGAPGPSSTG